MGQTIRLSKYTHIMCRRNRIKMKLAVCSAVLCFLLVAGAQAGWGGRGSYGGRDYGRRDDSSEDAGNYRGGYGGWWGSYRRYKGYCKKFYVETSTIEEGDQCSSDKECGQPRQQYYEMGVNGTYVAVRKDYCELKPCKRVLFSVRSHAL